ncbi:Probable sulfate transporter 3.3 [Striga hermonthica]|uniref:Probable sulfate transporter 3.3 n=1 Tax=Striga hermonthica TaxID=68872 RepID=A0A9N7N6U8_STRHE|nr:Probable sulfate transporter 3.3 [Striga hermonthica]
MLHFHGNYLGLVIRTGLVTGIISLTEGIAVGRTFAALKNYQVDGNKEMIANGLMNIVGSTTSCYVTTGAFSRSAVNHNAGCKTALSNIIMAVTVIVTLLFLMPLFQYTPNVVLGAIIVTAVVGLTDVPTACQIWKVDKFDFLVMLCAFFGVLFISVQEGLAIALVLVNPLGEVIEKLQCADNAKEYERAECLFLTVGEAVSFHLQNVKSFV